MNIEEKLRELRNQMKGRQIAAYIIPSSDPHQSEYVAEHWKARAWISGFTGSAGTAVVGTEKSGVWTDSRYFIQAEKELKGSEVQLYKVYNQGSPQFIDWIIENLDAGEIVGCDGSLFSKSQIGHYRRKLEKYGIVLEAKHDLISPTWKGRPIIPGNKIFDFDEKYAGESRASKMKRIRALMSDYGADNHLVSTLDDIAWILNIRGSDVTYNPVAISYLLMTMKKAILFIDRNKVNDDLISKLEQDGIEVLPYDGIWQNLNNLGEKESILIDEKSISEKLYRSINTKKIINKQLPSIGMKAIKNETEKKHFRNVMEKDGVALTRFYMWLEENIDSGLSEFDLVQKIKEFRSQQDGYQSESFGAIVGYKGNGAIVHYTPSPQDSAILGREGLLLIDSGGQYLDGTTDITRTISLGNPTEEEVEAYTRVLKGNIALDRAIFPEGTLGVQLDALARTHLWESKMNYLHGTGHGIGFFLNVHEGPQGFHPGIASRSKNAIEVDMVTTNEPGFYKAGKFGIRIENCMLTVNHGSSDFGKFLKFETLTLFPIATNLLDTDLLSRDEVEWINSYHSMVLRRLKPRLNVKEIEWMERKCRAI